MTAATEPGCDAQSQRATVQHSPSRSRGPVESLAGNQIDAPALAVEGPLLLSGADVCRLLSIGLSTLYCMDRSGELGPTGIRLRGRRLWPREELAAWVRAECPRRELWAEMWRNLRERV